MYVIKKDGTRQPFNFEKIERMVRGATSGVPNGAELAEDLLDSFQILLRNNITSSEIQEQLINTARNKIDIDNTDMSLVAGKLLMSSIIADAEKERGFEFGELIKLYKYNLDKGLYEHKIDLPEYFEILGYLESHIDRSKNYEYQYASAASWKLRYLHHAETPVEVFALIAARLALHTNGVTVSRKKEIAKEYLVVLSDQKISLATPFLLNLRMLDGNLSSCFIMDIPDSLSGQYDVLKAMALISKNGGGIGSYIGNVRAKYSRIQTVSGIADSVIPLSALINDTMVYVNQQGKRKGASTVGIPTWHADVLEYLDLVTEVGDARRKAMDIFLQVVVERAFIEALEHNEKYTIVCPLEVKEVLGIDLNAEPAAYYQNRQLIADALAEGKLKVGRTIRAREIFKSIMVAALVSGTPYWFFTDTVNKLNPAKDVDTIKCGNLCVTGDTLILTEDGNKEIRTLAGQTVNCWDGEEFVPTPIFRTDDGNGQKVLTVILSNDEMIRATEYHRWKMQDESIKQTNELAVGDLLVSYKLPDGSLVEDVKVVDVVDVGLVEATYCGTSPKRESLIFNNTLTLNCNESYSITNEEYTHTCNLVSLVLPNINIETDELEYVSKIAVDMLDTIVDVSTPPTGTAKKHNDDFRVLGIGEMGLADLMAKYKKSYDKDLEFVSEIFERISLASLEQSISRAKMYGKFPMYESSEWAKGKLYSRDLEWYKDNSKFFHKWQELFELQLKYGVRNLQLQAIAPNTSSSVLQGVTASIFPAYSKFYMDSSSLGGLPIFPKYIKENFWYYKEYKHYDIPTMNSFVAEVQKWVDSGISYEWVITLDDVTISDIAEYYIDAYRKGVKGIYYIRWMRNDGSVSDKSECASCAG